MRKKPHVRALMDSQRVKMSKTFLYSAQQYFRHIFLLLWKKYSSKNSVLVVSEILRLFVNMLTPNEKYSLSVKASVQRNQLKCNYLQIKKYFPNLLLHFQNVHKLWNTLKGMMSLIDDFFVNL